MSTSNVRIGHGYDIHRLQSGGELLLGGVLVAKEISAVAHSDGDVILHAIVDALLGATGRGDIGELFPNNDERWKNAPSTLFLQTVYGNLKTDGYRVVNVDVTFMGERPRLKPFKQAIRQHLAKLLDVEAECVGMKAGTNEGCDSIGQGEAIAAHAVVLIERAAT